MFESNKFYFIQTNHFFKSKKVVQTNHFLWFSQIFFLSAIKRERLEYLAIAYFIYWNSKLPKFRLEIVNVPSSDVRYAERFQYYIYYKYIDTFICVCVCRYVTVFKNTLSMHLIKSNKNYGKIYEWLNFFIMEVQLFPIFDRKSYKYGPTISKRLW